MKNYLAIVWFGTFPNGHKFLILQAGHGLKDFPLTTHKYGEKVPMSFFSRCGLLLAKEEEERKDPGSQVILRSVMDQCVDPGWVLFTARLPSCTNWAGFGEWY